MNYISRLITLSLCFTARLVYKIRDIILQTSLPDIFHQALFVLLLTIELQIEFPKAIFVLDQSSLHFSDLLFSSSESLLSLQDVTSRKTAAISFEKLCFSMKITQTQIYKLLLIFINQFQIRSQSNPRISQRRRVIYIYIYVIPLDVTDYTIAISSTFGQRQQDVSDTISRQRSSHLTSIHHRRQFADN